MFNLWCVIMSSERKKLLLEVPYSRVKEIINLSNSLKQGQWQLIYFITFLFLLFSFIQKLCVIKRFSLLYYNIVPFLFFKIIQNSVYNFISRFVLVIILLLSTTGSQVTQICPFLILSVICCHFLF